MVVLGRNRDFHSMLDPDSQNQPVDPKTQAERPIFEVFSKKGEAEYRSAMQEVGPYLTLGIQMAMFIAVCAGIGYWIDTPESSPLWTGIGAGFGAVFGLVYFLMAVTRLSKEQDRRAQQRKAKESST